MGAPQKVSISLPVFREKKRGEKKGETLLEGKRRGEKEKNELLFGPTHENKKKPRLFER